MSSRRDYCGEWLKWSFTFTNDETTDRLRINALMRCLARRFPALTSGRRRRTQQKSCPESPETTGRNSGRRRSDEPKRDAVVNGRDEFECYKGETCLHCTERMIMDEMERDQRDMRREKP